MHFTHPTPKKDSQRQELNRLLATHKTKQLRLDQEIHKSEEEKSRLIAMAWLRLHFPAGLLGSKEEVQQTFGTRMGTEVEMQVYARDGTPVWPRRRSRVERNEMGDGGREEIRQGKQNVEPRGHKRKASVSGGR